MTIEKEKTELDILAEKYIETKNDIKRLETMAENMKKEIVFNLNGKDELFTDFHKITNKEQIKDGVDIQKLKELYPEAYNACFKPSIYPVLRVK